MIANFFQSLEREGVSYLLISGQATVLYGAAAFSEDVDLWVKPTEENAFALLRALHMQGARYYKLTPSVETGYLLRGHGFHFRVPDDPEFYLDVMGRPPRVPSFDEALSAARVMSTSWGDIPTLGIQHLAALKTTQRLGDYPIIGRLAIRYLAEQPSPTEADYAWAIRNVHTADDLEELLSSFPEAASACREQPDFKQFSDEISRHGELSPATRDAVERWMADRMLGLRRADRAYWLDIIAELRALRASGKLMPIGQLVTPR